MKKIKVKVKIKKDEGTTPPRVAQIRIEEDIPPETSESAEMRLSKNEVNLYERKLNIFRGFKDIELRDKSFYLIIGLILLIVFLYFSDIIFINIGWKSSQLSNSVFELLKYLLSSLFGFVFALKSKEG